MQCVDSDMVYQDKMQDATDGCFPSKRSSSETFSDASMAGNVSELNEMNELNECIQNSQDISCSASQMSQPATQPIEDLGELEDEPQETASEVWGQLYPHCGTFPRIPLSSDSFRLGRGKTSDYVIRESDMGSNKWLTAVSKVQCEVIKLPTGVFLKDFSSNGTWVNGHKVGKGNMWPLEHNSEICFAGVTKKVFVFMSTTEQEKFPVELTSKYTISKVLGKGACGEVRLAFRIPDLYRVAIKIINKNVTSMASSSSSSIMNEVRILQTVNHPCVIALEDVIETKDNLFIVLELAEGGELFDKIIEKTKFNESEAKLHFYQIASAIKYLHGKNICHRDLKPENVLLCSEDNMNPVVKITDMGLSKLVDLGTVLKTFCGTPQYIAPEVVMAGMLGNYSLKVDCWSLGVILYILLSGTPPFSEDRTCGVNLRNQILTANYKFYPQLFDQINHKAKDLIQRLLKVNPSERLSAEEILKHPWLQDEAIIAKAEELMKLQTEKKAMRSVSDQMASVIINQGVKRGAGEDQEDGGEKRMRHGSGGARHNGGMCPPPPPTVGSVGDSESEHVVPNIDICVTTKK